VTHNFFDEDVAATYDDDNADLSTPEVLGPMIEFLAGLAEGGPALELGIGTGRVAVPLAQTGVSVHGIELSEAMAERLAVPATPALATFHSSKFGHEIELFWPDIAERNRVPNQLPIAYRVVVRC